MEKRFTAKAARGVCFLLLALVLLGEAAFAHGGQTISVGRMVSYLESLGWVVSAEPVDQADFTIPEVFDEVYVQYNAMQQEAGFNLAPYKGRQVTCYAFELFNLEADAFCRANLFVYKGKIIGGDVLNTALNGYILPLNAAK